jgi:hypothetical protein
MKKNVETIIESQGMLLIYHVSVDNCRRKYWVPVRGRVIVNDGSTRSQSQGSSAKPVFCVDMSGWSVLGKVGTNEPTTLNGVLSAHRSGVGSSK